MIVAYAGGVIIFCIGPLSQRVVITFLVSTKGGSCVFARCFAGSYRPPPVEIMNGPLAYNNL